MQDDEIENVKQALRLLAKSSWDADLFFVVNHRLAYPEMLMEIYNRVEGSRQMLEEGIKRKIVRRGLVPIDFWEQKLREDTACPIVLLSDLWDTCQVAGLPEDLAIQKLRELPVDVLRDFSVHGKIPHRVADVMVDFQLQHKMTDQLESSSRCCTSPEALRRLASHKDWCIRFEVARNAHTPDDVWMGMYKDRSKTVREAVQERASKTNVLDVLNVAG